MTSRFYSLDGQPSSRFALARRRPDLATSGRGDSSGWFILAVLTLLFTGWLAYSWLIQPDWPEALPPLLAEFLGLVELASAFTLAILWAGLLWQRRSRLASNPGHALSVDEMYALSPKAFEQYVANLFRRKGYRVAMRGRSGDHGVDLELTAPGDRRAIVQCKRYRDTVGEEIVRGLFGTLLHESARHAFLVTTADISGAARRWAAGKPMTLIDGPTLVEIAETLDGARSK